MKKDFESLEFKLNQDDGKTHCMTLCGVKSISGEELGRGYQHLSKIGLIFGQTELLTYIFQP